MDIDGLQKVQDEHKTGLTKSQQKAKTILKQKLEYETLLQKLETITDKTSYDVMVPLGGSKAFFEAQIEHTNEILVLLGDNWFAERSAKEAREICQRRIDKCQGMLDGQDKESKLYRSWLQEASKIDTEIKEDGTKDIIEDYDEEKEKQWRIEHRERVKKEKILGTSQDDDDEFEKLLERLDELEVEEELDAWEQQQLERNDSESDKDWSDSPPITDDESGSDSDSKTSDGPKRSVSFGNVSERLFSREQDNGNSSGDPRLASAAAFEPKVSTKVIQVVHKTGFSTPLETITDPSKSPRHPGELVELFHHRQQKVEPHQVTTPKKSILKKSRYALKETSTIDNSVGDRVIPKKMNFVTTPQSAVSDVVVERNPEDKATVASKEAKPKTQILSRFRATRINQ